MVLPSIHYTWCYRSTVHFTLGFPSTVTNCRSSLIVFDIAQLWGLNSYYCNPAFPFHSLSHKTILAFRPLQTLDTITTFVWRKTHPNTLDTSGPSSAPWVCGRLQVRANGKFVSFLPSSDPFFFFLQPGDKMRA